ncbi:dioxygenase [Paenibacillus sp. P96]|uniref:Dioxygenase n=1 Tax=Paenibacillus zeirhizosphaerae TaxID=2987519 RepID=A0ABT9FMF0_9BACL|nr:class III extradiol ring-cleavage dioxygenase [Paenibacillus sp. P96]MDP4095765.1 dioxygenase [Paenibacillus sp. P96]
MTVPALFVAHGSPALAVEDNAYTRFLKELGSRLPRPRGIVVFSAHWDSPDQCIDVDEQHAALHDFYGFPEEMYTIEYPAPGDPAIHNDIIDMFKLHNLSARPVQNRGLDHGVWVILRHMYPQADIPVITLSVDSRRSPKEQYDIGCMLSALREQDILIIGSGGLVHNLRLLRNTEEPESWATAFDDWIGEQLQTWNLKQLFEYGKKAPFVKEAVPSYAVEHFIPLFYAMGAADNDRKAQKLFQAYEHGCLSLNCWMFGAR